MSVTRYTNIPTPDVPPAGTTRIFVDEVDRHLKQIDAVGGIIDLTKGSGLIPNKTKIINSVADLPTLVGGKYPLEAKTTYNLGDDITVVNPFDVSAGDVFWTSGNPNGPRLDYFGVDPLFQGSDVNGFVIGNAGILCPNATLYDISDLASPNTSTINVFDSVIVAKKFGIANNLFAVAYDIIEASVEDGLTFTGQNWAIISLGRIAFLSASPTFTGIDFGTTTSFDINMSRLFISAPAGATGISGLPNSGNIIPGGSGSLRDSTFAGPFAVQAGGIDISNDVAWNARDNGPQVPDSRPGALIYLRGNVTPTVISDTEIPVKAAGVFLTKNESKFSTDGTGRITSLSIKPTTINIEADIILEPVSGNARLISAYIALNGAPITASEVQLRISSNDPKVITMHWEETLNLNNYVEIFLQNSTTIDNILGSNITFRVSE